ncbi:MAG: hypothetical protein ACLU4J_11320 [Butyricimonas paravirosa]
MSNNDQWIFCSALTRWKETDYKSIIGREAVVIPLNVYHVYDSTEQIIQTIKGSRKPELNTTFDGQYFSGQELFGRWSSW